jgi:formylglycine-generating enzyme
MQGCFFWKKKTPNALEPGEASSTTGLAYDGSDTTFHPDKANGNKSFEPENEKRPNLVFIEGGKVLLGYEEFEMTHEKKSNYSSTVESFFMDETEIANIHWLEYLFYIRQYSEDEYMAAIPDTAVWMRQFSFNDFYVENYLRHPAFRFYPVVGVSWIQANGYCRWRSDPEAFRPVIKEFTGTYVPKSGTGKRIQLDDTTWVYEGYRTPQKTIKESGKQAHKKSNRPPYRLPTEAEWIYAAQTFSYLEPYLEEKDSYKRIYPWDGNGMRNPYGKKTGYFFANFKRGRGDYAGIAGHKNDGAVYTDYIYAYPPNDVGLYNIAGNVNEWVQDIYEYIPKNLESFEFNKQITEKQDYLNKEINNFQEYLDEERYRVYKGGSWNDNAFWLSPFTRRYLTEDSSSSTIGFRCAMSAFPTKK